MNRLKHFIEWQVFGVCTAIGERMGIATSRIRTWFIYISFLTMGSPLIIYFILAFWINIKRYILFGPEKSVKIFVRVSGAVGDRVSGARAREGIRFLGRKGWCGFFVSFCKRGDLFHFDYSTTDYEQLMIDLAQRLNVPVVNNRLIFPEAIASGSLKFVRLPNGAHVNIVNCKVNTSWLLCRRKIKEQYYTLRFHELTIPGMLEIRIGDERMRESHTTRSTAYLTNALVDWAYLVEGGTVYKGIDILFSAQWLGDYLGVSNIDDVLAAYLSLQVENVHREPLDSEYRRLMQEVVEVEEDNPMRLPVIQNRIMLLVERFFVRLIERKRNALFNVPLSKADIDRVMQVEAALTKDIFEPAPTVPQLARMVSISESKLKKDFKLIYGVPVYEYFQKMRMQVAKDKLLSGDHSVKEVAMELGYSNLSNFTIAFKKEFGLLPSKLLTTN